MFKQLCVPSHTGRIAANLSHDLHRLTVNAQIGHTHGISVRSSGNGMKSITRAFSTSVSCAKALPFSLGANASVGTTQGGLGVERRGGETLRMIMFGKPGAGKVSLEHTLVCFIFEFCGSPAELRTIRMTVFSDCLAVLIYYFCCFLFTFLRGVLMCYVCPS